MGKKEQISWSPAHSVTGAFSEAFTALSSPSPTAVHPDQAGSHENRELGAWLPDLHAQIDIFMCKCNFLEM